VGVRDSTDQTLVIVTPLVTSLVVYVVVGLIGPEPDDTADAIVAALSPLPGDGEQERDLAPRPAAAPGVTD